MSFTVVIPTRPGDVNEELRYAARAWYARFPGVDVVTVGHRVPWWSGRHIPTSQYRERTRQWTDNFPMAMRAAAQMFPGRFVWAADDIFPMAPQVPLLPCGLADWPTWCRTLDLAEFVKRWQRRNPSDFYTRRFVEGMAGQLAIIEELAPATTWNADCHMPHVVTGDRLAELLELFATKYPDHPAGHWRAVYGALWPAAEVIRRPDPKAATSTDWVSTSPVTWRGSIGSRVRSKYRTPSPYEGDRREYLETRDTRQLDG